MEGLTAANHMKNVTLLHLGKRKRKEIFCIFYILILHDFPVPFSMLSPLEQEIYLLSFFACDKLTTLIPCSKLSTKLEPRPSPPPYVFLDL